MKEIENEKNTNDTIQSFLEDNKKFPNPRAFTFYSQLQDRVIWIDDDIDEKVLNVSRLIMMFNKEDQGIPVEERKPIKILIYTYGGEGQTCFSLLDTIAASKTPIYTINMGASMSAGFLILVAGHKRYCLKHSTALFHLGSGGTQGTYEQTQAQAKDYDHFVKGMKDYVIERCNIDKKTLQKHERSEWYMYAEDQLKYGVVDAVISDIDELI